MEYSHVQKLRYGIRHSMKEERKKKKEGMKKRKKYEMKD
jgi:hypothetical protein